MIKLSLNVVAQALHVALGALAVALPGWLWGQAGADAGAFVALAFAAVKEAWFDPRYEDAATRGDGLVDFLFWIVGVTAAWGAGIAGGRLT